MPWTQLELKVCASLYGSILIPETWLTKRRGVYGVFFKDSQILLLRSKTNGQFMLPGGGADSENETLLETLAREALKEVGLHVTKLVNRMYHGQTLFAYNPRHTDIFEAYDQYTEVYLVEFEDGKLLADDLVDDLEGKLPRWILIAELRQELFSDFWIWRAVVRAIKEMELEHLLTGNS